MFIICVEAIIYLLSYNLHDRTFKEIKRLKSLQLKAEVYLEPQANIYDVAFFVNILNSFRNKNSIIDFRLGWHPKILKFLK